MPRSAASFLHHYVDRMRIMDGRPPETFDGDSGLASRELIYWPGCSVAALFDRCLCWELLCLYCLSAVSL